MDGELNDNEVLGESLDVPKTEKDTANAAKKTQRGVFSRVWNRLFRIHSDDFEKRLQHISKEEAAALTRMKNRSHSCRRMIKHLIIFSVIFEVIAVGYAIITTRSVELNWKMRALRVLPMFLLPALSSFIYSALVSFRRMCDRKDQKTLKRLRAEMQAKINELKERTNYYTTQQLIQRYDTDPAAKAAAASVLASKLGADSGLRVYFGGDESNKLDDAPSTGKSNDVEFVQSSGLRNRKQLHTRSSSNMGNNNNNNNTGLRQYSDEDMHLGHEGLDILKQQNDQLVVEHPGIGPTTTTTHDSGWIARIAALLVGEDPTQSYALICGSCHMHNGLARKEDFPFITYYCPHCNALNRSKQLEEHVSDSESHRSMSSSKTLDDVNTVNNDGDPKSDNIPANEATEVNG